MDNVACEYEFIGKILNSIKERTYNLSCPKFESIAKFEKFKSAISISLNLGIIGVGVSVPKEYHIWKAYFLTAAWKMPLLHRHHFDCSHRNRLPDTASANTPAMENLWNNHRAV